MKQQIQKSIILIPCLIIFIVVVVGITQLYYRCTASPAIEVFKKDIYLTYNNANTGLIGFLEKNDGRIIYIDNYIDISEAIGEQAVVGEKCGVDSDAVIGKNINGLPLFLPVYNSLEELVCNGSYIILDLAKHTIYEYSAGGTGLSQIRFKGFFEVFTTYHSGPSVYYHLKEIEVPFDVKSKVAGMN